MRREPDHLQEGDELSAVAGQPEPGALEHHPFTVEGQIESYGKFARGAFRTGGVRGRIARIVVWALLAGIAFGIVWEIVNIIQGLR